MLKQNSSLSFGLLAKECLLFAYLSRLGGQAQQHKSVIFA